MSFTSCNKGVLGCMDTTYLPSFERLATFFLLKCLHSEPNGPELKLGSRFLNHYVSEMMLFFIRVKAFGAFSHPCPSSWCWVYPHCKYCQLLHHSFGTPLLQNLCPFYFFFHYKKSGYPYVIKSTRKVPERVQFWHENVQLPTALLERKYEL